MAGKKIYISSHIYMYYTVHDTSLQYAVTYNTLRRTCISYKQSLSGDTKI